MNIQKLANVGGISNITRYINMLTSNNPFLSTTTTNILLSSTKSPYINAWTWDNGIGSKYADPASLPSLYLYNYRWNPAKNAVLGADYTNGLSGYPWSAGFGTKYSNPSVAPGGTINSFAMSADGSTVYVGSGSTPWISAYPFSNVTGFGTKYANPSTLPTGSFYGAYAIDVKDNDTVFFAVGNTSPGVYAYAWSSGWGSKYADPATVASSGASDVSYNASAGAVAYAASTSYVYPWSAGFGTKYADPASGFFGNNVLFHTSGQSIVSSYSLSNPYMQSWAWSAGFGTKHANTAGITGATFLRNTAVFSDDGKIFGIGFDYSSPYYALYSYTSTSGFGFKYAVPTYSTGPTYSIAFS